jgi:hypothetical protein
LPTQSAEQKTLDTFDWALNATIKRAPLRTTRDRRSYPPPRQCRPGRPVRRRQEAVDACRWDERRCGTTSAQLLIRLTVALADKSLTKVLRRYAGWDLLLVGEFDFDRI